MKNVPHFLLSCDWCAFFECERTRLVNILFQSLFDLKERHQRLLNRLGCVELSTFTSSKFNRCSFFFWWSSNLFLKLIGFNAPSLENEHGNPHFLLFATNIQTGPQERETTAHYYEKRVNEFKLNNLSFPWLRTKLLLSFWDLVANIDVIPMWKPKMFISISSSCP